MLLQPERARGCPCFPLRREDAAGILGGLFLFLLPGGGREEARRFLCDAL